MDHYTIKLATLRGAGLELGREPLRVGGPSPAPPGQGSRPPQCGPARSAASVTNLSYLVTCCRLSYAFPGSGFPWLSEWTGKPLANVSSRRENELEGSRPGTYKRRPPSPPRREPARGGQVHAEAAAQVQGAGAGRAAECPGTKAPPGAWAEVTCCLQGRWRAGEGIWRKWGRSSLGNRFVPPCTGHVPFLLGSPKQMDSQVLKIGDYLASVWAGGPPGPVQKLSALCKVSPLLSLLRAPPPPLAPGFFHN